MAERRLLALLGPCRVDGVGGGVGYEDLRGLDGVDTQALHEDVSSRSLCTALEMLRGDLLCASRAAKDFWWAPLGLDAPTPKFACCTWWPDLVLPEVQQSGVTGGSSEKERAKRKGHTAGAESESFQKPKALSAPDTRWLDAKAGDEALSRMVTDTNALDIAATRVNRDETQIERMTNPAGAAARAVSLLGDFANENEKEKGEKQTKTTDVVWITCGVDGGGGGNGEWPPEAVAAYGVLSAVRRAGGKAIIIVLLGDDKDDGKDTHEERVPKIPPLLLEIAKRACAELRSVSCLDAKNKVRSIFEPSPRWRGGLTLQTSASASSAGHDTTRVAATLPGFTLRGVEGTQKNTYASTSCPAGYPRSRGDDMKNVNYPRTTGDAVLLEIVRLENIPASSRRNAPALRFEMDASFGGDTNSFDGQASAAARTGLIDSNRVQQPLLKLRDDLFAALTAASGPFSKRGAGSSSPGFLIRVPFASFEFGTRKKKAYKETCSTPSPHGDGPILLIRVDGAGGFRADALATLPFLLARVAAIFDGSAVLYGQLDRARKAAAARSSGRDTTTSIDAAEENDLAGGAGAGTTPTSVASTGRKRRRGEVRATTNDCASKRVSENMDATETNVEPDNDDDARERALACVAEAPLRRAGVVGVVSLAMGFGVADDEKRSGEEGGNRERGVRGKHKTQAKGRTDADGKHDVQTTGYSEFKQVLEALVAAQRLGGSAGGWSAAPKQVAGAEKSPYPLTAALLRAAADTSSGGDAVSAAIRAARGGGAGTADAPFDAAAANCLGLALVSDKTHPSRSQSKSGTSLCKSEFAAGGGARDDCVMDLAAAEAELKARAASAQQRERRERRERQRITMAPRHVPVSRRTGNTILAAATGNMAAAGRDRHVPRGSHGGTGGFERSNNAGGSRENKSGSGHDEREAPEPSESAVGAGAIGAPRNRVCTNCHIELAPIPGVNMSLMKHCYACGGTLGAL